MVSISNPPWHQYEDLKELLEILEPAMIVGGAVRNAVLGIEISDIDIATTHLPEEVMSIASSKGFTVIPTGIKHGTVTCLKERSYEVTTLRVDLESYGRHAKVIFSDSWEEDARRRDFTINALYSDFEGNIFDSVGGYKDLQDRLIRFIGDPEHRIKEDYLRILRFFRFYSLYGKIYSKESLDASNKLATNLVGISRERCTYEFIKLLKSDLAHKSIELMKKEVFTSSGLPEKLENTLLYMQRSYEGKKLSYLGKISTFAQEHSLVLSRRETKLLRQLRELEHMQDLSSYIKWINESDQEVLWDGIILKGMNNSELVPKLGNWMENKFPVQGRDLIDLGLEPGPLIQVYLTELKNYFYINTVKPMDKQELLAYCKELISTGSIS
jgi:poly(A) polymerase